MKNLLIAVALLLLSISASSPVLAACTLQSINVGETKNGFLSTDDCFTTNSSSGISYYHDLYQFTGTSGQQLYIQNSSSAFDAYLVLVYPDGTTYLRDDDSGDGTNARIPGSGYLTLPASGTYSIQASLASSIRTGAYTLSLLSSAPASAPTAIEYYKADIDHYFMTADPDEATSLDNNKSWNWGRTCKAFNVWLTQASAPSNSSPVCRFYGLFANGTIGSHFYTIDQDECADVKSRTEWGWTYESNAFYAVKPAGGSCPSGTLPVYRVFNNGMGGAPNHRYLTSQADVNTMVSQGWVSENVVMCASSASCSITVTAFVIPSTATALEVPITTLTATDDVGVTGYMVTESSTAPSASSSDWTSTKPPSHLFATEGAKTLYAWARNGSGLVSAGKSATVTVTLPPNAAPVVTAFVIPSASTTLTVSITTLTATDDVGVTGYMVTESSTVPSASSSGWTLTKPPPYKFSTEGTKTLYAWAKDGSGLVSASKNATVTVTAPAVSGSCGSSNGKMLTTEPSGAALCSVGKPSNVSSASSSWSWTCGGSNGGVDKSCSANKSSSPTTLNGTWSGTLTGSSFINPYVTTPKLTFSSDGGVSGTVTETHTTKSGSSDKNNFTVTTGTCQPNGSNSTICNFHCFDQVYGGGTVNADYTLTLSTSNVASGSISAYIIKTGYPDSGASGTMRKQ